MFDGERRGADFASPSPRRRGSAVAPSSCAIVRDFCRASAATPITKHGADALMVARPTTLLKVTRLSQLGADRSISDALLVQPSGQANGLWVLSARDFVLALPLECDQCPRQQPLGGRSL
jgi:hypothetical protein